MRDKLVIDWITNWIREHKAEERSIEGFWNYFNSYRDEYPEEFTADFPDYRPEYIEIYPCKASLTMNWPSEDYSHIVFELRIRYKNRHAAIYKMVFNLDGTVEDDKLTFD
jgi:hypothetical protein